MVGREIMKLESVSLADKYELQEGRVYMTGTQALIRLPLMQRQRDLAAGLNTAGFISGYRGSPLGAVDQQLWSARKYLEENQIQFQPGVNEELAATTVWGSQQSQLFNDSEVDGIFGMWYGKGPGVDRTGDVFKHANAAGTSKHGGVLVLAGDDHNCKSSTLPHQTEYAFMDACIPVLYPAGVQEFLDLGVHGIEMSRFSGCWTAFKVLADNIETSASVYVSPDRIKPIIPTDFEMPEGGLNIRIPHTPLEQEHLLHKYKLYAALAYCKANKLNKTMVESPKRRLGIITAGKTYLDVRQALEDLQITEEYAKEIGISIYKVGMVWPLERDGIREFAEGHEEIIVIEEKRALLENQIKEQLYNWNEAVRPRVVGKFDENQEWILPSTSDLTPARIARVIVDRLRKMKGGTTSEMESHFGNRLAFLDDKEKELNKRTASVTRIPYFCSGCPHNTSTKVPEGSRALAGIGCHYMASWMDRETHTFTQMGGEGTPWIGQAKFSKTKHVFANLGDGTYFHSGILAVRQSIAAGVNITYKILYNDAVAMTGGQPIDGVITSGDIAHQVKAEGAKKVVVVTDEPEKYTVPGFFPAGTEIFHRHDLDHVQKMLRDIEGVTVMVYDQTCASEKRRRRKRGTYPDPAKRAFINEAVCEGCGDCGEVSNCVSVTPKETAFGRKRVIDQSGCNKDFSCVDGFCPSFVTVHGGKPRKGKGASDGAVAKAGVSDIFETLPAPKIPVIEDPYGILITGVGGTGVVTIGALLGMAAHLEGKGCSVLDMAGLAQKGGSVTSHIQIANTPEDINAVRIAAGGAKLVLGCDMITASNFDAMSKTERDHTKAIINTHESVTGEFTKNADFTIPTSEIKNIISDGVGKKNAHFVEATAIATALMGDSIASNMFMLGYAFQNGFIPVSEEAIIRAIELNGVAIKANQKAFLWGRRAAHNLDAIKKIIGERKADPRATQKAFPQTAEEIIAHRMADLTAYQNSKYANMYEGFVRKVQKAEKSVIGNITEELTVAVAKYLYKLMAYKDEYEVARLYTDGRFMKQLNEAFEGDFKVKIHLAPPSTAEVDPNTGKPKKREYGPWMLNVMKVLPLFKGLRGTKLDPFGRNEERKIERRLIKEYQDMLDMIVSNLNKDNHATAVALATLPEHIRGYGHVKDKHLADVEANKQVLLAQFKNPSPAIAAE
ncbi:indolepyruvate ferredoxin oxidoreductase family protein [Curvivirga aplysinae]|uniref:indolepyruvate ferredoxin oxidoreductase family protein n=1 Tax=Curvivirga aplysinae TaxID=2529852 RepID=UPI0012BC0FB6|nr:indolepyruvate ferredoxin oxidoreductase family protein [Curvivirga aplysinae]MTI10815.1 indolepyruvate ferredoxin oxidoreductase family protein [Curvivirga aplysinae]